ALPYGNFAEYMRDEKAYMATHNNEPPGGPQRFYHMMVVDAFSSDAIPAHLITKEAIKMYFDHLAEKGILCVHTSNRHVSLPKVENYWTPLNPQLRYLWTDDYYSLWQVLRTARDED